MDLDSNDPGKGSQSCDAASFSAETTNGPNHNNGNKPQSPSIPIAQTKSMKIAPTKANIIRKHSKQLFRCTSSDEEGDTFKSIACKLAGRPSLKSCSSPTPAALCTLLPDDLICKVTSFLDDASLLQVRKCSRYLRDLASRNEAGWEFLCRKLWADKIHVPSVPETVSPCYFMKAYFSSIQDAFERQHLTIDELCYDPESHSGTVWSFRFKESAGIDWTAADPWHCGLACRKMVFLKDGSVRQYVPASTTSSDDTDVSNSTERPELISPNFGSLLDSSTRSEEPQQPVEPQPGRLVPPPLSMSWRMLTRPLDLPTRPMGSYVRFSVGGREVPTYSVRRSPTGNWGFVMESCWGVYASFEPPPKQRAPSERRRLRRTETGARWVEVLENGEETLSASQQGGVRTRSMQEDDGALMDDASLVITNEIQWREAFLYNVGARILPEGEDAADEFDRAFRGIPN